MTNVISLFYLKVLQFLAKVLNMKGLNRRSDFIILHLGTLQLVNTLNSF